MNDDTTKSDGWDPIETTPAHSDETARTDATGQADQGGGTDPAPPVGYCQDCGRPLTPETLRAVGTGVFCEPCLTARIGGSAAFPGYTAPGYMGAPPNAAGLPPTEPSPVLAAILGFIPGVGAMYNGQFAKGIVHLLIFAVLVSLSDNVNGIFGLFVAGWMFYMVFEAYHTAVARRDGLPLPNAFGFNDIGERMGFGTAWGTAGSAARPAPASATTPPAPPAPPASAAANPTAPAGYPPEHQVPVGTAPDWVRYVPPARLGGYTASQWPTPAAQPYASQPPAQAMSDAAPGSATLPPAGQPRSPAYAQTFTGATPSNSATGMPTASAPQIPEIATRRIPTGALWLIGLGVLILMANLLPDWKRTEQWWSPALFAGLSVWLLIRRLQPGVRLGSGLLRIIRWPVILMVLAMMLALHEANLPVTMGLTVSVLLIVYGALLLVERAAGADAMYPPPTGAYPYTAGVVSPQAETPPSRAAWTDSGVEAPPNDPDHPKHGG